MAAITQSLGLFGVTGELGRAFFDALEEQAAFVGRLRLFASEKSCEETRLFRDKPLIIENPDTADYSDLNEAILCLPPEVADDLAPRLLAAGVRVWDASGHLGHLPQAVTLGQRGPDDLLMVCDEALAMAVSPLLAELATLLAPTEATLTLLQPASMRGRAGVRELAGQTGELLNGRGVNTEVWPQQVAFNVLPADTRFDSNGMTRSEQRLAKALAARVPGLPPFSLRSYQVPVFYGATLDVCLRCGSAMTRAAVLAALAAVPGLLVHDQTLLDELPTPVKEGLSDGVHLSRLMLAPESLRFSLLCDPLRAGLVRAVVSALIESS